ncbi:MAG TPA: TfpX/TfpZ family type IV pilin accessory protein, partial [Chthoniobacterales bacterium]|nr:TfpX/TfpZ family type IV pilin accessory protein [Chthoniobacterales bacterium]
ALPQKRNLPVSRWKAAAIHLCISAAVAALASALLLGVWYPPPYFHADGAGKLLALVVGVDVSIGPLLTLLVFKSGKRGLKLDLTVIAILQFAALIYGFHVLVSSRPVFMVAAVDRFVLVSANELSAADLAQAARPKWRRLSWTGPVLVGAKLPEDPKQRTALMFSTLHGGKDIQYLPRYYVDYSSDARQVLKRAHSASVLRAMHPDASGEITRWLRSRHLSESQVVWVPIQAHKWDMVMMMDANNGQPIAPIPLNPWKDASAAE